MLGKKQKRAQPLADQHFYMHFKNVRASAEVIGSLRGCTGGTCDWLLQGSFIQTSRIPEQCSSPLPVAVFVRDGPQYEVWFGKDVNHKQPQPLGRRQCLLTVKMVYFRPRRATSFLLAVFFVFRKHRLSSHNPGWPPPSWVAAAGFELLILPQEMGSWAFYSTLDYNIPDHIGSAYYHITALPYGIIPTFRFSLQHYLKGESNFFCSLLELAVLCWQERI